MQTKRLIWACSHSPTHTHTHISIHLGEQNRWRDRMASAKPIMNSNCTSCCPCWHVLVYTVSEHDYIMWLFFFFLNRQRWFFHYSYTLCTVNSCIYKIFYPTFHTYNIVCLFPAVFQEVCFFFQPQSFRHLCPLHLCKLLVSFFSTNRADAKQIWDVLQTLEYNRHFQRVVLKPQ